MKILRNTYITILVTLFTTSTWAMEQGLNVIREIGYRTAENITAIMSDEAIKNVANLRDSTVPPLTQLVLPKFFDMCNKNNIDVTKLNNVLKEKIVQLCKVSRWAWTVFPRRIIEHDFAVKAAHFSPDCTKVVTISRKTIKIVDAQSGNIIKTWVPDGTEVVTAEWSPDSSKLMAYTGSNILYIYDLGTSLLKQVTHDGRIWSTHWSPDSRTILTGSADGRIHLIDSETGNSSLEFHTGAVRCVVFSPDGKKRMSASEDTTAIIVDRETKSTVTIRHNAAVRYCSFSPDGTKVLTKAIDNTIKITDVMTGKALLTITHNDEVTRAAFSSDSMKVITTGRDKITKIIHIETGIITVIEHFSWVREAAFSPDSSKALIADYDGGKIINLATGAITPIPGDTYAAAFNPDSSKIAIVSNNRTVRVIDLEIGVVVMETKHQGHAGYSICFSSDSAKILVMRDCDTVEVLDANTGILLERIRHNKASYSWVLTKFSSDGSKVVTCSYDKTACIAGLPSNADELLRCLQEYSKREMAEKASRNSDAPSAAPGICLVQ